MAAAVVSVQSETVELWDDDQPPQFGEQDLEMLAFELWQRASCPENPAGENWMSEEEALRTHSSCL